MEIYSIDQLQRILASSKSQIVFEIMDMNDEVQQELHQAINTYLRQNYGSKILFLKINKNFYHNIVKVIDCYPTYILYYHDHVLAQRHDIQNLDDFQVFLHQYCK